MSFSHAVEIVGKALDTVGVLAIAIGILLSGVTVIRSRSLADGNGYRLFRQGVGRAILLGLEFLVAADIIRTVALSPTLRSAAVLAVIVLIRTFLSFALEVELDGRWPWQVRQDRPPRTNGDEGRHQHRSACRGIRVRPTFVTNGSAPAAHAIAALRDQATTTIRLRSRRQTHALNER